MLRVPQNAERAKGIGYHGGKPQKYFARGCKRTDPKQADKFVNDMASVYGNCANSISEKHIFQSNEYTAPVDTANPKETPLRLLTKNKIWWWSDHYKTYNLIDETCMKYVDSDTCKEKFGKCTKTECEGCSAATPHDAAKGCNEYRIKP